MTGFARLPPIAACPRMLTMPPTCAASFTLDPPCRSKHMLNRHQLPSSSTANTDQFHAYQPISGAAANSPDLKIP